jgi:hypothetical protein
MKFIKSKKAFALLATLVVAGIAAYGAVAYWTTGGSGTGSGATGTTSSITVNQTSASSGLYPGGSVSLAGDFTNTTNPGSVYVHNVTASVDSFSQQADLDQPACTEADFSISGTATVNAEVAHGTSVGSWSGLSLNMTDGAGNQDNCKSITVPITYTANAS